MLITRIDAPPASARHNVKRWDKAEQAAEQTARQRRRYEGSGQHIRNRRNKRELSECKAKHWSCKHAGAD